MYRRFSLQWYPSYLNTYGKERGRPVLPDDQNVVLQIANLLKQVLPTHEKYFLKEIESRLDVWLVLYFRIRVFIFSTICIANCVFNFTSCCVVDSLLMCAACKFIQTICGKNGSTSN